MANTTDVEVVRYVADVSNLEAGQRQLESTLIKSKVSADALNRSLKDNVQSSTLYKQRLAELDEELKKNGKLSDASEKEQKQLKSALDNVSKSIKSQTDTLKGLEKQTQGANAKLKETPKALKEVEEQGKKTSNMFSGLGKILVAFFTFNQIKQFVKDVFSITAEFEKLEAVLTNTLGSNSLARKALKDIQEFAKATPFGVKEVAGAFIKLANQGFTPTIKQLEKLGDLVSSTGKTFDQLAEALLDAQQGQYRRLLEFGIRAEKQGDKVAFTFKGVKTVVDDNAESIRNFIVSLGDFEGVAGASAAVAEALGGKVNKLGDAFDQFLLALSEGRLKKVFGGFIDGLSNALDLATELVTSYEGKLSQSMDKFVADRVEKQDKADKDAIQALIENGKSKLDAEEEYYKKRLEQTASATETLEKNIKSQESKIKMLVSEGYDLSDKGKLTRAKRDEIQADINLEEKYLLELRYNLKLRTYQRDQYNKNLIDNEKAKNATLDNVDKDAAKNAKKAADDEAKRLAELERQRRAYNDFNISLIENDFDRERATKKEHFIRTIEDSKKNIGEEITTNSAMYKLLSDKLISDLEEINNKEKALKKKQQEERTKAIIDGVNAEIKAREDAGKIQEAYELKKLRDNYEAQLAAGANYSAAKTSLDEETTKKTFEIKRDGLNKDIELLEEDYVKFQGNSDVKESIAKQLQTKITEIDNLEFNERERLRKKDLKAEEEKAQRIAQLKEAAMQIGVALANDYVNSRQEDANQEIEDERAKNQAITDNKLASIDKQVENGYLSQKKADQLKSELQKQQAAKEAKLKVKQFEADKKASISRALIGAAESVIRTFSSLGYPAGIIPAATVAALTAIEVASIQRQKPPKFKDGVIDLQGKGTGTSDSIDAKLSRGESVMTAKETKQYKPEFEAIRAGTFERLMKQKYSTEAMSFLPYEREQVKKQEAYRTASERAREKRDSQRQIDLSQMERLTKKNGHVAIRNAEEIGKAVARNLPSNIKYSA